MWEKRERANKYKAEFKAKVSDIRIYENESALIAANKATLMRDIINDVNKQIANDMIAWSKEE